MDAYCSPGATVIQTDEETLYLPHDSSYPNARHVINPFLGNTNDNVDDTMHIDNDPDIQLDNFSGSCYRR